jgi:hypothetical protein
MMENEVPKKIQALLYQGVLSAQVPVKAIKAELINTAKVVMISKIACLSRMRKEEWRGQTKIQCLLRCVALVVDSIDTTSRHRHGFLSRQRVEESGRGRRREG